MKYSHKILQAVKNVEARYYGDVVLLQLFIQVCTYRADLVSRIGSQWSEPTLVLDPVDDSSDDPS